MGYRLTFYDCPKSVVERLKNTTDEQWDTDDYEKIHPAHQDDVKEMWYDCTMWLYFDSYSKLCKEGQEDKVWSRFYENKLEIESDLSFNTMNKEQCLFFINMIKSELHQIYKRRVLNVDGEIELCDVVIGKKKIEDLEEKYPRDWCNGKVVKKCNCLEKARLAMTDAVLDTNLYSLNYMNTKTFDKNMSNPYKVSYGSGWESVLTNLIYIYKTLDWDNRLILICGG